MASILVTGSNGQLGNELQVLAKQTSHTWHFTDIAELDICNPAAISKFLSTHTCDFIINCAAYTAVDKAETDVDTANKINAEAPKHLAEACKLHNSLFIHISTDYVFDGTKHTPYIETDTTNPQSVYGTSKLQGEQNAISIHANTCIIRTSWLYSSFGNNFVKTMIRLGKERDQLNVIFDQIGTPTYARDLATAIIHIVNISSQNTQAFIPGIYHYSNEGVCSWFDFAKEIHDLQNIACTVLPIETKDYPTPAKRPHYSVLNKTKIKSTFNISISHWKDSLKECVQQL